MTERHAGNNPETWLIVAFALSCLAIGYLIAAQHQEQEQEHRAIEATVSAQASSIAALEDSLTPPPHPTTPPSPEPSLTSESPPPSVSSSSPLPSLPTTTVPPTSVISPPPVVTTPPVTPPTPTPTSTGMICDLLGICLGNEVSAQVAGVSLLAMLALTGAMRISSTRRKGKR